MAEIIIIGGGLTGLSAAFALEALGVTYTLIEVKPRPGGGIQTVQQNGFVMDGAHFVSEQYAPWPWLEMIGLSEANALVDMGVYRDGRLVAFRDGTQTLIDRLSSALRGTLMLRMAVSSLGSLDGAQYGVCLENGLILEARAIVIAAPARYAEHMLRSLAPEAAVRLFDYRYDPTIRVSIGLSSREAEALSRRGDIDEWLSSLQVTTIALDRHEALPSRIPPDHALLRVHLRVHDGITAETATQRVTDALAINQSAASWAHFWPEADPLTRALPEHAANLDAIDGLLPPRVVLVGSDYRARRLDQQVMDGMDAARRVALGL